MTALMGLSQILRTARLQVITDLRGGVGFGDFCRQLYAAGVDVIQVRDTTLTGEARDKAIDEGHAAAFDARALYVVGRDLDQAMRCSADVFHLGASDGELAAARAALHEYALVGRSVHEVAALKDSGADYLLVGPVYGTDVPGPTLVREAAAALPVTDPSATVWFAVGGITPDNLPEVIADGAVRVAVSSSVTKADDPIAVASALAEQLRELWKRDDLQKYRFAAFGGGAADLSQAPPPPAPGTGLRVE